MQSSRTDSSIRFPNLKDLSARIDSGCAYEELSIHFIKNMDIRISTVHKQHTLRSVVGTSNAG